MAAMDLNSGVFNNFFANRVYAEEGVHVSLYEEDYEGNIQLIEKLLQDKKSNDNQEMEVKVFLVAVDNGDYEIVRLLISTILKREDRETILTEAFERGLIEYRSEIVNNLLLAYVDPNKISSTSLLSYEHGDKPLHYVVKEFLDIRKDSSQEKAQEKADKCLQIIKSLLSHPEIELAVKNNQGEIPFDVAIRLFVQIYSHPNWKSQILELEKRMRSYLEALLLRSSKLHQSSLYFSPDPMHQPTCNEILYNHLDPIVIGNVKSTIELDTVEQAMEKLSVLIKEMVDLTAKKVNEASENYKHNIGTPLTQTLMGLCSAKVQKENLRPFIAKCIQDRADVEADSDEALDITLISFQNTLIDILLNQRLLNYDVRLKIVNYMIDVLNIPGIYDQKFSSESNVSDEVNASGDLTSTSLRKA